MCARGIERASSALLYLSWHGGKSWRCSLVYKGFRIVLYLEPMYT